MKVNTYVLNLGSGDVIHRKKVELESTARVVSRLQGGK